MLNKTPNGELLSRNSLFDMLGHDRRLYLLHVTNATESITQHGALYPSGGCLVGSIYCAPLIREPGGFRMHNLGEYVLTREAPAFVRDLDADRRAPTPLVIEITMPPDAYRGLAGIDYLRLGEIHLQIFLHLEYLLSRAERHRIRAAIVSRVRNSMAFLSLCNSVVYDGTSVDSGHFLPAQRRQVRPEQVPAHARRPSPHTTQDLPDHRHRPPHRLPRRPARVPRQRAAVHFRSGAR